MAQVKDVGLLRQIRRVVTAQCPSRQTDQQLLQQFLAEEDEAAFAALVRAKAGEEKPTAEEVAKFQNQANAVPEAAARKVSVNNLKQIGLAFHNYHNENMSLPLHAIYSQDTKKPLLSWRVSVLPYLGQGELYKQFKLDEPWDSAHNKKLIAKMPSTYVIPFGKEQEGYTHYQVVTGPDTLFDGLNRMGFNNVTDGLSNTLLVVEARESVVWTKPADLTMPKEKDQLPPLGGHFKNGFHILLADGSVRMLPRNVPPATFRAAVTPSGND